MPLSSVLGASSVIKPGVCTSTTRPSVPYTGQLIYETDTRRVAGWNGSAWIYETAAEGPPGLVFIKSQTIGTAVTSVTVSDAFSATYSNYRVVISGGIASATPNINLRLGSTTTGYYYSAIWMTYNSNTVNGESGSNQAQFLRVAHATTNGIWGVIDIGQPFEAKNTNVTYTGAGPGVGGSGLFHVGGGNLADTTSYTAFTIFTGAGETLTGGTIRVYGYANS